MTTTSTLRRLALAGALGLVAATLSTPPANALPAFSTSSLDSDSGMHDDASCAPTPGAITPSTTTPVPENGAGTTVSSTASGTVDGGGGDTQTGSASITATAKVTAVGAEPKSISLNASAAVQIANTVADSACEIHVYTDVELDFGFTLTRPMLLTLSNKTRGTVMYTELYLYRDDTSDGYSDDEDYATEVNSNKVVLLQPGVYGGYFHTEASRSTDKAASLSGTSSLVGTFVPVGSQTAAAAGKGKKYVTLPSTARSCATDTITASVTGKAKRAKTVTKLTVFVNGKAVKSLKKPSAGKSIVLSGIGDGDAAVVKAVAKLAKKANGKPRKPAEVTATYAACSPS